MLRQLVYTSTSRLQKVNPLNAELNPICYLLALLGSATIVVISRLSDRMNCNKNMPLPQVQDGEKYPSDTNGKCECIKQRAWNSRKTVVKHDKMRNDRIYVSSKYFTLYFCQQQNFSKVLVGQNYETESAKDYFDQENHLDS